jgi:hypothetical protein
MIDKNLRIAFGISLGIHIFALSAVMIVVPDLGRKRNFTRVDFLGPILEKTAFDIMLENANPVAVTSYSWGSLPFGARHLEVSSPGKMTFKQDFPEHLEYSMDSLIIGSLADYKTVPDFYLDAGKERLTPQSWNPGKRRVIYTPEPPYIMRGLYGGKDVINMQVRVLVSPRGDVRKVEPVTTTGYPQLDILAAKFARSWMFERKEGGEDEWLVLDVKINTKE